MTLKKCVVFLGQNLEKHETKAEAAVLLVWEGPQAALRCPGM